MDNETPNILVVEDNSEVLDVIIKILEYAGYKPQGLTRYNELVWENIENTHPKLIILDVMLNGADGRDLARELKHSKETENVPILMISAYTNVKPSVLKAGADDFLAKPFGMEELIQKVETNLLN